MKFVYFLESTRKPSRRYIAIGNNLNDELIMHNAGHCRETMLDGPWNIAVAVRFQNHEKASEFLHYLETPAGKAYANKRLWCKTKLS